MNIQGEFDQLVHNVVKAINDVLVGAANAAIKEGSNYMQNEDGSPIILFEKIGQDSYEKIKVDTDGDGIGDTDQWVETTPDESENGYKGSLFSINNITLFRYCCFFSVLFPKCVIENLPHLTVPF